VTTATDWTEWLEQTALATTIRQELYFYPVLEILHILGIVGLVGGAFLFDLRLLGYGRNLPVQRLAEHVLPWSRRGLALVIPSGLLLFITNASILTEDPTFWLKLILIGVAGLNALVFHQTVFRTANHWNQEVPVPQAARLAAAASILLWTAVIVCGRLLAY
jgi:hypothetical protein